MTVQELIDKLKDFDPDLEVVFTNTGFGHEPVDDVYKIKVDLCGEASFYMVVLS